jgi:uncharacterized protein YcnI
MTPTSANSRLPVFAAAVLLLVVIVALQFGFAESSLLYLSPALLILLPLVFGRYPGERLLRAVIDPRRHRRTAAKPQRRHRRAVFLAPLPRGGALLAAALAGRAPPRLAAARSARLRICQQLMKGKKMMRRIAFPVALLCSVALPAIAQAHVSLHPNEVPTGSFATLDIRVPNEKEGANTVKLAVQVPPGFLDVSTEYMPGWTSKVVTGKLAKPIQTEDGEVTEQVREVIWTGDGKQGLIPPGQFLDFGISTEIPGSEGEELSFKTLQYYDNGEVVRWIGGPNSEEPAPQIDVTAAGGVLQDVAGSETAPPAPSATASEGGEAASGSSSTNGASKGLGIAALIVGALGLLAGSAALVRSRRSGGGGATA